MLVLFRCCDCSVLLENEVEELHQRVDDAVDWSIKYNKGENIRILCPKCADIRFGQLRLTAK